MRNFHGKYKTHPFFEGWYLKHQGNGTTIAFIPSFHVCKDKKRYAQIQVVTENGSHCFRFPPAAFHAEENRFYVRVGANAFSSAGINVDLQGKGLSVKGTLQYGALTPPETDMMGPFRHVPMMQCNHGVLSLTHSLTGTLEINGEAFDFTGGTGYIEKDWGCSFPKSYLWAQLSWFENRDCCTMLSIADIPFAGTSFTGCIASVYYGGREYRLATYRGAKILKYSQREALIEQGPYRLRVQLIQDSGAQKLQAPQNGEMARVIKESPACMVRIHFMVGKITLFDVTRDNASFEFCVQELARRSQTNAAPPSRAEA